MFGFTDENVGWNIRGGENSTREKEEQRVMLVFKSFITLPGK